MIDDRGIRLIKQFEELKLTAYQDQVQIWTIGWGHTGPDVHEGMTITLTQAEMLLRDDIALAEKAVDSVVTVTLSRAQKAAIVSWTFNLGAGRLATSSMLSVLNSRDYFKTLDELVKWKMAGGKPARGLARRRHAEAALFCEDKWPIQ